LMVKHFFLADQGKLYISITSLTGNEWFETITANISLKKKSRMNM
jgi:hypothetical protein